MTSEQLQEAGPRPDLSQVMNPKEEPPREGEYIICKAVLFHCLPLPQTKQSNNSIQQFHYITLQFWIIIHISYLHCN